MVSFNKDDEVQLGDQDPFVVMHTEKVHQIEEANQEVAKVLHQAMRELVKRNQIKKREQRADWLNDI